MTAASEIRIGDSELKQLARDVGKQLEALGHKLATAESCTGGWVAKLITDVAGSSAWLDRGFVTYSNAAKQDMLDVAANLLERHGAVSAEVVAAMTAGALAHSQADWAVAISGIAGPDGGTEAKPVGLVWFAWQHTAGDAGVESRIFEGDRDAVRRQACAFVLEGLLARLQTA
ncbi:MAG: nicotinamide-nucleotide amidase [Salinisphaeraceae bacterium]|nr:nicotinamide-nucleotide amidase [Salinisphaeraceae bacterium]